jgi:hypothetical protein
MTDPAIIEAAARALRERVGIVFDDDGYYAARTVLAAVTPLIRAADAKLIEENIADLVAMTRAAALEQAAVVAEEFAADAYSERAVNVSKEIAAAIRALKEQP